LDLQRLENSGFPRAEASKALQEKKTFAEAMDHLIQLRSRATPLPNSAAKSASTATSNVNASAKPEAVRQPTKPQQQPATTASSLPRAHNNSAGEARNINDPGEQERIKKEAMKKRQKEAEQQRLRELKELEERHEAEEKERKAQALENRKQLAEEAAKRKKETEDEERLQEALLEQEREALRREEEEKKWMRRLAEEKSLPDPAACLQEIHSNYGPARLQASLRLLTKVLRNVLEHPREERFLSVKLSPENVQKLLVRPLGAWVLLRSVGFELNGPRSHLFLPHPDRKRLEAINNLLQLLEKRESQTQRENFVKSLFASVNERSEASVREQTFFALSELYKCLHNVISLPEERNFRSLDKTSDLYLHRMAPCAPAMAALEHFGFRESKSLNARGQVTLPLSPSLSI
jgi:hypothetical protein